MRLTSLRHRALLAVALATATPATLEAQAPDPLVPDSVLAAPGSPRIVRLAAPSEEVVTLRLSVPLDERPAEAGWGRVLQLLAQERLEGAAASLGARVESGRTPWGVVYTVTGTVADLDYLAYLLREAARAPSADPAVVARVRNRVDEGLQRLEETGGGRVEAELRARATPEAPAVDGTRATLALVSPQGLRDLWARTHQPEGMTLVVAGRVADPVLLASLAGLGAPPSTAAPTASGSPPPAPRPADVETLRRWHGVAWSSPRTLDPRAAVAAVLLSRDLRDDRGDYEARVRLWETPGHTVIGVVGAAYPRQAAALARRLGALLDGTAGSLGSEEVREVAGRLHRDLVLQGRTPWGRAHLVGRFLDAGLPLDAARGYLNELKDMDEGAVRVLIEELRRGTTHRAEVRP